MNVFTVTRTDPRVFSVSRTDSRVFAVTRTDPRVFSVSRTDSRVFAVTRTDPRVFTASRTDTPVNLQMSSVSIPSSIYTDDSFNCSFSIFNLTITDTVNISWELVDESYSIYSSGLISSVANSRESTDLVISDIASPSVNGLVIAVRIKIGSDDWVYSNWVELAKAISISSVSIPSYIWNGESFDCSFSILNLSMTKTINISWELVDESYSIYSSGLISGVANGQESTDFAISDITSPSVDGLVIAVRVKIESDDWVYSDWVELDGISSIPDNPTPRGI